MLSVITENMEGIRLRISERKFRSAAEEAKDRIDVLRLRLERDDIDYDIGIRLLK